MHRVVLLAFVVAASNSYADEPAATRDFSQLPASEWVKLSPLADTPPSPRLGYN